MEHATISETQEQAGTQGIAGRRVTELRSLAEREPAAAADAAWLWLRELGERRSVEDLDQLFSGGIAPQGLDGPTEGILVMSMIQPVLDFALRPLTAVWMPWIGKRFDAVRARGDNRLAPSAEAPSRLLWPRYRMERGPDGLLAFEFETRLEPGGLDPHTEVLVIDYAPVERNPGLLIKSIRDELVEIVPGVFLGKILFRRRADAYRNLGFFALRAERST